MGCFDSFYNKDNIEIQVKTYDAVTGGYLERYSIGDIVPTMCTGHNFEVVYDYGYNYNIFPYTIEDYVILIRDGRFADTVHYTELENKHVSGVSCYSKHGALLKDVKTVSDYRKIKESFK